MLAALQGMVRARRLSAIATPRIFRSAKHTKAIHSQPSELRSSKDTDKSKGEQNEQQEVCEARHGKEVARGSSKQPKRRETEGLTIKSITASAKKGQQILTSGPGYQPPFRHKADSRARETDSLPDVLEAISMSRLPATSDDTSHFRSATLSVPRSLYHLKLARIGDAIPG